jgi:tetrapyrrole (corrin/porphyrin) methylase-like protein
VGSGVIGLANDLNEAYPSAGRAADDWRRLAADIHTSWSAVDDPAAAGGRFPPVGDMASGSLVILGSGIQSLGFTADAEQQLRAADRVFFCVADVPTAGWLRTIRPDAYDLYVLYDDTKPRYHTYVQMTEAMLHFVRRGENVVAVYYGHPGIFVLSTHRAIRIARREGLRAVMRPGISALDCLCADLGVDPAQPGLQTHEATDMLIRRRRLDPTLHVVLWQVGLIGEMGYRRKGFLNRNLEMLIDYLQATYGPDHLVTHYVAARYPTLEPQIATYELRRFLEPKIRATLTGISTFYIPPRDAAPVDLDVAISLGLARPGDVARSSGPIREIAQYGRRERRAIAEFDGFAVPLDYQYQPSTAAARFLIDLARDVRLQARYSADPIGALSEYHDLSDRERSLLATRNEGALQLAAKGTVVTDSPSESLVHDVLRDLRTARELAASVNRARAERSHAPLRAWERARERPVDWRRLPAAVANVLASSLNAWTGIYLDEPSQRLITIVGNRRGNRAGAVFVGSRRIRSFSFANHVLAWDDGPSGCPQGELQLGYGAESCRRASGRLTGLDGSGTDVTLDEPELRGPTLASWVGRYLSDGDSRPTDVTVRAPGLVVTVDGAAHEVLELRDGRLQHNGGWLAVTAGPGGAHRLSARDGDGELALGVVGDRSRDFVEPFVGAYRVCRSTAGGREFFDLTITADSIAVGGADGAHPFRFEEPFLSWTASDGEGRLHLYLDALTLAPAFSGSMTGADGTAQAVYGIAASTGSVDPQWALRHVGAPPLPAWAIADLTLISRPWIAIGGLHLESQWRKTHATHFLIARLAATLPSTLNRLTD